MITVVLGLCGALVYGAADFLGGLASRTLRPVTVTAIAAVVGIAPLLVGVLVLGARFSSGAVLWGVLGGLSGAIGVLLLYAALAVGPMSVLSPLTAVFSAIVPVAVGVARGTALSPLAVGALVVAVAAIVLVASVRDRSGARLTARGVVTAVAAGSAFGGLVLAFNETAADSGVAPLLVARALQALVMGTAAVVVAVVVRRQAVAHTVPDDAHGRFDVRGAESCASAPESGAGAARPGGSVPVTGTRRVGRGLVWTVIGCGVLDATANVFIQAGLHSSDDPLTLPIMGVLNALYPIGTVVLAGIVLRERLTPLQATGIVLAIAASVGLALA